MRFAIRQAGSEDIPFVAELFDHYRQFYGQAPDRSQAERFVTDRIVERESVILVAASEASVLIGFCQLYPTFCSVEAQPIYVLYDLFVRPETRRMGVGRTLLQAAEERSIEDGKARIDLSTAKTNTSAQALYESLGWVRDNAFLVYSRRLART